MKYWFYFFCCFCVFQLVVLGSIPFGGVRPIVLSFQYGMFNKPESPSTAYIVANYFFTYLYFGVLIAGILIPVAYKMDSRLKYKIGIFCGLSTIIILLIAGRFLEFFLT